MAMDIKELKCFSEFLFLLLRGSFISMSQYLIDFFVYWFILFVCFVAVFSYLDIPDAIAQPAI